MRRALAPRAAQRVPGYPTVKNAREVLVSLYSRALQELTELPEGCGYRTSTAGWVQWRLDVVKTEEDIEAIENEIESGTVEELIEQAENELRCIDVLKDNPEMLAFPGDPKPPMYYRVGGETHEIDPNLIMSGELANLDVSTLDDAAK